MHALLIVLELLIAVALVVFVLLQKSEGGALGIGGSGSGLGGLFSPRGAADTLTRVTAILATLFFLVCIGLNLISLQGRDERSILDQPISNFSNVPRPSTPAPLPTNKPLPAPTGPQVPNPQ